VVSCSGSTGRWSVRRYCTALDLAQTSPPRCGFAAIARLSSAIEYALNLVDDNIGQLQLENGYERQNFIFAHDNAIIRNLGAYLDRNLDSFANFALVHHRLCAHRVCDAHTILLLHSARPGLERSLTVTLAHPEVSRWTRSDSGAVHSENHVRDVSHSFHLL
jgi:hypothetical protein